MHPRSLGRNPRASTHHISPNSASSVTSRLPRPRPDNRPPGGVPRRAGPRSTMTSILRSLSRRPLMLGQGRWAGSRPRRFQTSCPASTSATWTSCRPLPRERQGENPLEADAARVPQPACRVASRAGRREVVGTAEDKTRLLPSPTALMERATRPPHAPASGWFISWFTATKWRVSTLSTERAAGSRAIGLAKVLQAVAPSASSTRRPPAGTPTWRGWLRPRELLPPAPVDVRLLGQRSSSGKIPTRRDRERGGRARPSTNSPKPGMDRSPLHWKTRLSPNWSYVRWSTKP